MDSPFSIMVAIKIITDNPFVLEEHKAKVNMIAYKNNDNIEYTIFTILKHFNGYNNFR